ncbi:MULTISPECIES: hypothetical protein [Francisella]|nr:MULTISPECIES: hypothetical protein [Francisella]APC92167.1 hypothetical protein BBG19_1439 [Francisella sp. MA067296]
MQELVFFIIKIFFVLLAVSVLGIVAAIIIRKDKQDKQYQDKSHDI